MLNLRHCLSVHIEYSCNKEYSDLPSFPSGMWKRNAFPGMKNYVPSLDWNSSVWEILERDIYKCKFLFLWQCSLKNIRQEERETLHWFWLFNTQEWKSVKSQSLYHHQNAVSCQITKIQAACSLHTADINKPSFNILTIFLNTCYSQTSVNTEFQVSHTTFLIFYIIFDI